MPTYTAPVEDMMFLFEKLRNNQNYNEIEKYQEVTPELVKDILEEAAKINQNIILPLAKAGDENPAVLENGVVITPPGYKEAYKKFIEDGWTSLSCDPKYGGQGMPKTVSSFFDEMLSSASLSFKLYSELSIGAYNCISHHASDSIKDKFLPKMVEGKWSGTMCLTEPVCGTDLGLIKTMAIPQDDSSYKITGTKIFITCGEHDLSKNIVHLVLARTPNAPEGIKGISLFLVPKILPNRDGSLGQDNSLQCGSIEKKLGINASPTCVMHYNEAKGWLVGELNKGMKAMFIMMNGARLFVGVQGLGISEIAYQSALYYAKERLQGKATDSKNIADPILVHPEIRKNLLHMKSLNEGIRALMMWVGSQFDIIKSSDDNKVKNNAENIIALMTPILKSFATDVGCESANLALQIYGGHGYIKDHGMEQLVRDARIAPIYEGTNGIQALDLVGRKMQMNDGEIIENFFSIINNYLNNLSTDKKLETIVKQFKKSFDELVFIANHLRSFNKNKINEINGTAVEFLQMFSYVSIGYIWLKLLIISIEKNNDNSNEFLKSKIATGKYYFNKVLPQTSFLKDHILSGASNYNDYKDEYFDSGFTL